MAELYFELGLKRLQSEGGNSEEDSEEERSQGAQLRKIKCIVNPYNRQETQDDHFIGCHDTRQCCNNESIEPYCLCLSQ